MESEKEIKTLMTQFHDLLNALIDHISNSKLITDLEPNKATFMRMIIEYISHNYTQYKHVIKDQVEDFFTKAELSKNFILNSIEESILNIPIEDIIKLLEESQMAMDYKRNCFSLNENQIRTHKMLFDLEKVFNELRKENIGLFNKTDRPIPITNQANTVNTSNVTSTSLKSIEKKKAPNAINTTSIEKTPKFCRVYPNKNGNCNNTNQTKENKNQIASMYHSPSPVIVSKTKRVIEKKCYCTPEKKNHWL